MESTIENRLVLFTRFGFHSRQMAHFVSLLPPPLCNDNFTVIFWNFRNFSTASRSVCLQTSNPSILETSLFLVTLVISVIFDLQWFQLVQIFFRRWLLSHFFCIFEWFVVSCLVVFYIYFLLFLIDSYRIKVVMIMFDTHLEDISNFFKDAFFNRETLMNRWTCFNFSYLREKS